MFPVCVGGKTKRRKQWSVSVHRSTRLYCKDEARKEEVKSTLTQLRASKDKWSQRGWTRAVKRAISDLSINTHGRLNNNGGNRNEEHKSEATTGLDIDQNSERHCVASILPRGCEISVVELLRTALRDHGFIVLRSQVHVAEAQAARVAIDDHSRTTLLAMGCDDLVHHGVRGLSKVRPWKKWYKTPIDWDGKKWGIKGRAGYNRYLGGGRMFISRSFMERPELRTVQNRLGYQRRFVRLPGRALQTRPRSSICEA